MNALVFFSQMYNYIHYMYFINTLATVRAGSGKLHLVLENHKPRSSECTTCNFQDDCYLLFYLIGTSLHCIVRKFHLFVISNKAMQN